MPKQFMNYYKSSLKLKNINTKGEAIIFFYWKDPLPFAPDADTILNNIKKEVLENTGYENAEIYRVHVITKKQYKKANARR